MQYSANWLVGLFLVLASGRFEPATAAAPADEATPLDKVIRSKTDLWGETAIRQENGPSYEFFEKLLPPIRYVNAPFLHYPLVLGAPRSLEKARFVSNGSGINLSAYGSVGWRDVGFPVTFRVGDREELYGQDVTQLDGPHFDQGYLPIVRLRYREYGSVYGQEAFAAVEPSLADHAAVFVRFTLPEGNTGQVTAHVAFQGRVQHVGSTLRDAQGNALLWLDGNWRWNADWKLLKADLPASDQLHLVVFTKPMKSPPAEPLNSTIYESHQEQCTARWQSLLDRGMQVETPEAVVNNAWRSMIVGTYSMLRGEILCYSAHNQYEKLYVGEGSDAIRSLLVWGYGEDVAGMIPHVFKSFRQGLLYHRAGMKLQLLIHYFWLTRDADYVNDQRKLWMPEVARIVKDREPQNGLLPRERYCGDVGTQVYSARTNANAWRGLRDAAAMLAEIGREDEAAPLAEAAQEFRLAIRAVVKKSESYSVEPPFVPMALFGVEQPYDVLTATKEGSYWDLVAPYLIDSGVFGVGGERERWLIQYLERHGGISMGMIRCRPNGEFWVNKSNLNDLYGRRYTLALLRNDEPEKALVGFYGKLAQGCTRDTFYSGEGSCLVPADPFGRQVFLPPNSAGNGFFLWMLRYLLVQDWDLDDDGKPETLRLMFATPRRWLEDGSCINVARAPSAFGEVSVSVYSRLSRGEVVAEVAPPPRPPKQALFRVRLPQAWKAVSARAGPADLPVDPSGTVDISGRRGKFTLVFQVERRARPRIESLPCP